MRVGGRSGAKRREECGEMGRVSEGWGLEVVNGETMHSASLWGKVRGGDQELSLHGTVA
jgi:hypothetical protein